MDIFYDFMSKVYNYISNNLEAIINWLITGVSLLFLYMQVKENIISNFLEIESKVIQLKNDLDLLEKNEKKKVFWKTIQILSRHLKAY